MKTRTDILNHLIQKHGLNRYLEIGLQASAQNFDKIECEYKISVDPDPNANASFCTTSDKFFAMISKYNYLDRIQIVTEAPMYEVSIVENGIAPSFSSINSLYVPTKYDLVFIDGEHSEAQVEKDFYNALKVISSGGFICMHDTSPVSEDLTHFPRDKKGTWNGSTYKFAARLQSKNYFTVDIDHGVSVYRKMEGAPLIKNNSEIDWEYFNANRKELLNLVSWDEFLLNA